MTAMNHLPAVCPFQYFSGYGVHVFVEVKLDDICQPQSGTLLLENQFVLEEQLNQLFWTHGIYESNKITTETETVKNKI